MTQAMPVVESERGYSRPPLINYIYYIITNIFLQVSNQNYVPQTPSVLGAIPILQSTSESEADIPHGKGHSRAVIKHRRKRILFSSLTLT